MKAILSAAALALLTMCLSLIAPLAHAANCSSYPYTLTNGQTADATQVMANFNSILACGNSNLAHSGSNSDITSLSGLITPLSIGQGGTGNTTGAPTLVNSSVTNAILANMADQTIKGNVSGGAAAPSDLTAAQVETMIQGKLPFEFYVFVGGLTGNNWQLARYIPSTNVVLTTAKSACSAFPAATSTTTYTLKDNGVSIGTAVVTSSSCTATITSSPYTLVAGHTLTFIGPATADATLENLGVTFGGTRN